MILDIPISLPWNAGDGHYGENPRVADTVAADDGRLGQKTQDANLEEHKNGCTVLLSSYSSQCVTYCLLGGLDID